MNKFLCILILIFGCLYTPQAQSVDSIPQTKPSKNTFFTVFRGNPGKAALFSLVLPGSGQLYNGQWWKAPIVWGAEGGLFAYALYKTNLFKEFNTGYEQLLNGEITMFRGLIDASQVRLFRDRFQRQKDFAWVYFSIAHLLNVIDAFVSRHLQEFDIDEDLGFDLIVPGDGNSFALPYTGIGIVYKFGGK